MPKIYGGQENELALRRRTEQAERAWIPWFIALWSYQAAQITDESVTRSGITPGAAALIAISYTTLVDEKLNPYNIRTAKIIGENVAANISGYAYDPTVIRATALAREQSSRLITVITETQREMIRNLLASGNDANLTVQQIAANIRGQIGLTRQQQIWMTNLERRLREAGATGDRLEKLLERKRKIYHRMRSMNIARSETAMMWNKAGLETFKSAHRSGALGIDRDALKTWNTAGDERVCNICGPLDGETVPVDENYPGGYEHAYAHPQCRCTDSYSTKPRR